MKHNHKEFTCPACEELFKDMPVKKLKNLECDCNAKPGEEHKYYCDSRFCPHCGYPKVQVTPKSVDCNHVYYPENCDECKQAPSLPEKDKHYCCEGFYHGGGKEPEVPEKLYWKYWDHSEQISINLDLAHKLNEIISYLETIKKEDR